MSRRLRLWVLALGLAGLAAMLAGAYRLLPRFGGAVHPYGERAVRAALSRHTANVISSVNFDQRAFDTLGEESILFGAVLGTVVLLRQTRGERQHRPEPAPSCAPCAATHWWRCPSPCSRGRTWSRTASSAPAADSRAAS